MMRTLRSALVLFFLLVSTCSAHHYYTVSPNDGLLRKVDIFGTKVTEHIVPLVAAGDTIQSCHGATVDWSSSYLLVIVQLASQPAGQHSLVRAHALTGATELIGHLGNRFAAIASDEIGNLYGLTASTAMVQPSGLFSINPLTGSTAFLVSLAGGNAGETLAFNIHNDHLYHAADTSGGQLFEMIDPVTFLRTPIPTVGAMWGNATAMRYNFEGRNFILVGFVNLHLVIPTGTVNFPAMTFDHVVSGIAGLDCTFDCGDCDSDGNQSTILDALKAAQFVVDIGFPTGTQALCCDVNNDKAMTVIDALLIAQVAVGLPITLTCP